MVPQLNAKSEHANQHNHNNDNDLDGWVDAGGDDDRFELARNDTIDDARISSKFVNKLSWKKTTTKHTNSSPPNDLQTNELQNKQNEIKNIKVTWLNVPNVKETIITTSSNTTSSIRKHNLFRKCLFVDSTSEHPDILENRRIMGGEHKTDKRARTFPVGRSASWVRVSNK